MGWFTYFPASSLTISHALSASLYLRPQHLSANISIQLTTPSYDHSSPSCPQALGDPSTSLLLAQRPLTLPLLSYSTIIQLDYNMSFWLEPSLIELSNFGVR